MLPGMYVHLSTLKTCSPLNTKPVCFLNSHFVCFLSQQTCQKLEEERIEHLKEMFSLYSNMLAAVTPEVQQV